MRALLAALALLLPAAAAAAEAAAYVSCQDRSERAKSTRGGIIRRHAAKPLVSAEQARGELEESVRRWEEEAKAFRGEVHQIVQKQFDERRRFLGENYEQAIRDLEVLERNEREAAIVRFEEFLARYPDDPQYTPDAIFRLAELYYEKANDDFELASEAHRTAAKEALAEGREAPPEPMKSYAPSIALYQQLITGFPEYKFIHGMYYLLAYCLGEMGQGEEAQVAYRALIERYPESPFVPEAWVRLGDWQQLSVSSDGSALVQHACSAADSVHENGHLPPAARYTGARTPTMKRAARSTLKPCRKSAFSKCNSRLAPRSTAILGWR